ncbi:hypothetical protein ACRALDRAFT_205642 [Sodiomyces alcalophilus JCM 7366]|uniref:uncharacterized protein n=1 Tax=Sodiomyces alcalophilus JCM 7366 TaxID=591952 RepID=UPI0039B6DFAF
MWLPWCKYKPVVRRQESEAVKPCILNSIKKKIKKSNVRLNRPLWYFGGRTHSPARSRGPGIPAAAENEITPLLQICPLSSPETDQPQETYKGAKIQDINTAYPEKLKFVIGEPEEYWTPFAMHLRIECVHPEISLEIAITSTKNVPFSNAALVPVSTGPVSVNRRPSRNGLMHPRLNLLGDSLRRNMAEALRVILNSLLNVFKLNLESPRPYATACGINMPTPRPTVCLWLAVSVRDPVDHGRLDHTSMRILPKYQGTYTGLPAAHVLVCPETKLEDGQNLAQVKMMGRAMANKCMGGLTGGRL